jgi:hypothetical protein
MSPSKPSDPLRPPLTVRLPAAVTLRRLKLVLAAIALALVAAGCATSSYDTVQPTGTTLAGHEVADDNNDGTYVSAGALTYQLQVSRQLNPYAVEDSQYIHGLPQGTVAPNGQQLWYGVFMWAKNQQHAPHTTSDNFEIIDTQGNVYKPLKLDKSLNPFAWTSETLGPNETEPGEDTTASEAFTQGGLLLFKLPETVYSNRPLTLYILSPDNKKLGEISLDL